MQITYKIRGEGYSTGFTLPFSDNKYTKKVFTFDEIDLLFDGKITGFIGSQVSAAKIPNVGWVGSLVNGNDQGI